MNRSISLLSPFGALLLFTFAAGCGDDGTPNSPLPDAGSQCPPSEHPDGMGGCTSNPCVPNPCAESNRGICMADGSSATCQCNPGYHDESGACIADTTCTTTTCNGHGTCSNSGGMLVCSCEPGYVGSNCQECDTQGGYISDGMGGCTNTPCDPNPCSSDKPQCTVQDGMIVCECGAGTHEENGFCVPDATCMPSTCGGHGTCTDAGGSVSCTCDPGWAPPFCGMCDDVGGYHSDGMGGCTQDPCLPNPCKETNKTVCSSPNGTPVCSCDVGYHEENGACVVDQVCMPGSCNGHGTCSDAGGIIACTCDPGYVGSSCLDCDTVAGYHSDGMGGCTQDPCLPNPCVEPNKTICMPNGPLAVCSCDSGYHDDGTGVCTDDPCKPNPCAAQNQACQNNGGMAECYTPMCDDQNPCTTDSVVNGVCVYTTLPDGAACSTTLCLSGQICQAGMCGGGAPINCSDSNPCTIDDCNAVTGCSHVVDNTIVPDDGVMCTIDACQNGAPYHTATNSLCNDNLYCTGTESCAPTNPNADANGCIHSNVPSPPPAPGPCASYGACSEALQGFPLITQPAGGSCNDGIFCTQNDVCDAAGACQGMPTASCSGSLDCANNMSPMPGTIDVPFGTVTGTITLGGQALPSMSYYSGATFYLKAKDTGALHSVAYYNYSGGNYSLNGPTWSSSILPGVYDLWYRKNWDSTYDTVSATSVGDPNPNGMRLLQPSVILGSGANTLDIDVPYATVSGAITLGGQPLPAMSYYSGATFYLKAKDTGAMHSVAYFNYSGGNYSLNGPTWTASLLPGDYELWYRKNWDSTYNTVTSTSVGDPNPNGMRRLNANVTITPGANTLDIDVPNATVSGAITLGGQALPPMSYYSGATFYLKAKDTGALHSVAYFNYSGGNYSLNGPTWTASILPGNYELWYRKNWDSSYNTVTTTSVGDPNPNGMRILDDDVTIAPGANTLDIDLPNATVSGTITLGGQPLPPMSYYSGATFYLKAKDTGALHSVAYFNYSGGNYSLNGPTWTASILPGNYELWYRKNWDSSYNTVTSTSVGDPNPNGMRMLSANVVLAPGANTLDIDVPVATVTGTITLGGMPLPSMSYYSGATFYLKAKDTGALHSVAYFNYSGGNYSLNGPTWTASILPGNYELWYRKNWDSTYNTVSTTSVGDPNPNGMRILDANVTIAPGANTLDINVPITGLSGSITLGGQPLPPMSYYSGATFYLVADDTTAMHSAAYFNYSGGNYSLNGPTWTSSLLPGVYDLVYRKNWDSEYNTVSATSVGDPNPNGMRMLGTCLTVP
ncbi:MAG: hypothetical protein IPM54_07390 [Polyangiaceae bacterium]|nr:hypothetical protein [Polyangiaceae bacterium]